MNLPQILHTICDELHHLNAKAIVVGGSVRDHFLQIPIKDYDIEVFGLDHIIKLENILKKYGKVKLVGKSFGVLKFVYEGQEYDFSFPRNERKIGRGHRGFEVFIDGKMSFKEAARRRDFTINAMGYDIGAEKFLDPYSGRKDIAQKIIRHIDDNTFVEDPLRVYRGVQFCARFGYRMDSKTKVLCQQMVEEGALEELPKERIFEEFNKLLLQAEKPSIGFLLMNELDILRYFPKLKALVGVVQDPKEHPEGDVWTHTLLAVDVMKKLLKSTSKHDLMLMYAILCHDFGKVQTTQIIRGHIRAFGHQEAGIPLSVSFMHRLTNEQSFIEQIVPLVRYHMEPSQLYLQNASSGAILKLSTKVKIADLVLVAKANLLGRRTKEAIKGHCFAADWLYEKAKMLGVLDKPPGRLILGRDLIALGMQPSAKFQKILDLVYEKQLDGKITTKREALEFIKKGFDL